MKTSWPLMPNNVSWNDRWQMAKFCLSTKQFTNGPKVKEFEKAWSEWLGCKDSIFVSSGSTANYLLLAAIKEYYNIPDGAKVLVPSCTWVTNIAPVIQLGLQPVFVDIDPTTFTWNEKDLEYISKSHKIQIVFTTHLMGFTSPSITKYFPSAIHLDDVCESHGAMYDKDIKVGSNSSGATFSFYFGHHMTTIEGGMICVKSNDLADLIRVKRSHGLARESLSPNKYYDKYKQLTKEFLFVTDGYNFRNHELCAVLGLNQLKRLDNAIKKRKNNFAKFQSLMKPHVENQIIYPNYNDSDLSSSFCFPLVFKHQEYLTQFKKNCDDNNIEYRPIISGNLLEQPFLKHKYKLTTTVQNEKDTGIYAIHHNGVYVGNNQFITSKQIKLLNILVQKSCQ